MLRCSRLVSLSILFFAGLLNASDADVWKEYGLVHSETVHRGNQTVTSYQLKDLTGAIAAFEWQRPPHADNCQLASFCAQDEQQTIVSDANYIVKYEGPP